MECKAVSFYFIVFTICFDWLVNTGFFCFVGAKVRSVLDPLSVTKLNSLREFLHTSINEIGIVSFVV